LVEQLRLLALFFPCGSIHHRDDDEKSDDQELNNTVAHDAAPPYVPLR
jgi:hypothetical protein